MTISRKSLLFKIFQLTFPGKEPNNLCSYVRNLAIAMVIFILIGWFYLILAISIAIDKKHYILDGDQLDNGFLSELTFKASCVLNFCVYMILSLIMIVIYGINKHTPAVWTVGFAFLVIILALIILLLLMNLYSQWHEAHPKKPTEKKIVEKKPNVFIEYIKAKTGKYCPPITWKD